MNTNSVNLTGTSPVVIESSYTLVGSSVTFTTGALDSVVLIGNNTTQKFAIQPGKSETFTPAMWQGTIDLNTVYAHCPSGLSAATLTWVWF